MIAFEDGTDSLRAYKKRAVREVGSFCGVPAQDVLKCDQR